MSNPIYQISPFTLLDYPDKTACIVWFAGCNMRCRYCYNIDIVRGKGKMSFEEILQFLDSRKNLLDGVVLSGGECTMHQGLESFIREIKNRNLLVKLDTNGSNPTMLKKLIRNHLVNYVSLDFKSLREYFYKVTRSDLFNKFERSLELLIESELPFEIRTTIHSNILNKDMIQEMILFLEQKKYRGIFYLQNVLNNCETLGNVGNDYKRIAAGEFSSTQFEIKVRN